VSFNCILTPVTFIVHIWFGGFSSNCFKNAFYSSEFYPVINCKLQWETQRP